MPDSRIIIPGQPEPKPSSRADNTSRPVTVAELRSTVLSVDTILGRMAGDIDALAADDARLRQDFAQMMVEHMALLRVMVQRDPSLGEQLQRAAADITREMTEAMEQQRAQPRPSNVTDMTLPRIAGAGKPKTKRRRS